MLTFFPRRISLPCLFLGISGLMVCCGCGGDQQTATSTTQNASSPGAQSQPPGPPPPPVTSGQYAGSTSANPSSGGTGAASSGTQLNMPAGGPVSTYGGPTPNVDPNRDVARSAPGRDLLPPGGQVPAGPPVAGFEIGSIAPEIEGDDLEGEPFRLSDYRGKVVVLDFWGDW